MMLRDAAQQYKNMIFMGISQLEITSFSTYMNNAVKLALSQHQLFTELLPHPASGYGYAPSPASAPPNARG